MAFSQHDMLFILLSITTSQCRGLPTRRLLHSGNGNAHHFNGGNVLIKSWQALLPITTNEIMASITLLCCCCLNDVWDCR